MFLEQNIVIPVVYGLHDPVTLLIHGSFPGLYTYLKRHKLQ